MLFSASPVSKANGREIYAFGFYCILIVILLSLKLMHQVFFFLFYNSKYSNSIVGAQRAVPFLILHGDVGTARRAATGLYQYNIVGQVKNKTF